MRRDFVDTLGRECGIARQELLEKDLIIHLLLLDLSKSQFTNANLLFKGGTCLIKHYLGYFRFSEDIDFTWRDQGIFVGQSASQIRNMLSSAVDHIGETLETAASKRDFDFRWSKGEERYVELRGGGKICTFKVWYHSEVLDTNAFVKVTINFLEKICFTPLSGDLKGIYIDEGSQVYDLFPEYRDYSRIIAFSIYDLREILCEKVRAILTRRGVKARDFVDIFLIKEKHGIEPKNLTASLIEKTNFSLRLYEKYRQNLDAKRSALQSGDLFEWGSEKDLLLTAIDERQLYEFVGQFQKYLRDISSKLQY